jgi:hypothetical protein
MKTRAQMIARTMSTVTRLTLVRIKAHSLASGWFGGRRGLRDFEVFRCSFEDDPFRGLALSVAYRLER